MQQEISSRYLDCTRQYLNGYDIEDIAKSIKISKSTLREGITQTFYKLVIHFEFKERNILYPVVKNVRGGRQFKNAREHKDFWLGVISDYESGVRYNYQVPESKSVFIMNGIAKRINRSEISVHYDGVTVSCDSMPACAYNLIDGKKYRITIEEITENEQK